jgi:hypothetical protein
VIAGCEAAELPSDVRTTANRWIEILAQNHQMHKLLTDFLARSEYLKLVGSRL